MERAQRQHHERTQVHHHRWTLLNWLGIYPTITLLLWLLPEELRSELPLPVLTLIVTAVVVPIMSYVVMPQLAHLFRRWLAPTPRARADASAASRATSRA